MNRDTAIRTIQESCGDSTPYGAIDSANLQREIGRRRFGNWISRSPSVVTIVIPAGAKEHAQALPKAPERIRNAWEGIGSPKPLPAVVRQIAATLNLCEGTVERVLNSLYRPAAASAGTAPVKKPMPPTESRYTRPAGLTPLQVQIWNAFEQRGWDPGEYRSWKERETVGISLHTSATSVTNAQLAWCKALGLPTPVAGPYSTHAAAPEPPATAPPPVAPEPEPEPTPAPVAAEEQPAAPVEVTVTEREPEKPDREPLTPGGALRILAFLRQGMPEQEPLSAAGRRRALRLAADCPDDLDPAEWARVLGAARDAAAAVA